MKTAVGVAAAPLAPCRVALAQTTHATNLALVKEELSKLKKTR